MSAHANFAPSSAARWLECPFSAVIGATLPNPDSEASREGTRVHTLIEKAIAGEPIPEDENEDVAYGIEMVLDFVNQLGGLKSVLAEQKVHLSKDVWGTVDILQPDPYVTTLLDYKNGAMDVAADRNMQLMTYAAATLEEKGPSKFYRLVIVQPNSRTAGDQRDVKQSLVPLALVEEHREKVLAAVERGMHGEGPKPGRHCRYCSAFGNCEATQQMLPFIMTAVRMLPSEIPNATAVRMLTVLRGLEDMRKALEKDVVTRFAAGQQVPGAEMGMTSTHRKWGDDRMAVEKLIALYGMNGVDPISPAQAEKMGSAGVELAKTLAFKPTGSPKLIY
jgi:hypothetical protein